MSDNTIRTRVRAISQRLPDQAQDSYYATPEARMDTILGNEAQHYIRLRKVKAEWDNRWKGGIHDASFPQYLVETYGIKMRMEDSGIGLTYEIVDEQKHTLFLLKFGS